MTFQEAIEKAEQIIARGEEVPPSLWEEYIYELIRLETMTKPCPETLSYRLDEIICTARSKKNEATSPK